jgi:TRAP-type C4-dicarboxylate transport system permease small subunit
LIGKSRKDLDMQSSSRLNSPKAVGVPTAEAKPWGGGLVRSLVRVVDWFNAVLLFVLSIGLGILFFLALAQVVWRYVLGEPLVWSEEVIRYALIWTVFLGAGITVRKGMLAAVELVTQLVPAALRRVLVWLSIVICCAFWAVLLAYGIIILDAVQGMSSGALEMPMPLVYLAIPVGAGIALVNTLAVAVDPPEHALDTATD